MGDKSVQKKRYIVDTARKVFMEKGFRSVTMKDIVDACQISRGGLYLYFESTEAIFLEVLRLEKEETDDVFGTNIPEDATEADILALFLKEQKKEILRKKNNLSIATYEYFFMNKKTPRTNPLKQQLDSAVKIIEQLIIGGVERGIFECADPLGTARNMMFVLEGLKITSQTIGIGSDTIDKEVLYLMQGIVVED